MEKTILNTEIRFADIWAGSKRVLDSRWVTDYDLERLLNESLKKKRKWIVLSGIKLVFG